MPVAATSQTAEDEVSKRLLEVHYIYILLYIYIILYIYIYMIYMCMLIIADTL